MAPLADYLTGSMGRFWPLDPSVVDEPEPFSGYLRLKDDLLHLEVLDDRHPFALLREEERDLPDFFMGATTLGGVLLLNPSGAGSTVNLGGSRLSTMNYRFKTIVTGMPIRQVQSGLFFGLEARFPTGVDWGQLPSLEQTFSTHESGKLKSATLRVGLDVTPVQGRLPGGLTFRFAPDWRITGPSNNLSLRTALGVRVTSRRRRPMYDFLQPLLEVQSLLSIANGKHAPCGDLRAHPHLASEVRDWPFVWDRDAFREPINIPEPQNDSVRFTLPTLGGALGVRRWIEFVYKYPRFVRPVTLAWQFGRSAIETRLLEMHSY